MKLTTNGGAEDNMSPSLFLLLFLASLIYILRSTVFRRKSAIDGQKLPPGPPPLPIIGNLHMLGNLPHRSLHRLAQKYGPIMYLRLGSVPTIVVSSPEAAEQFLKTHDLNFASRPLVQASHYLSYGTKGVAFTPYGSYWRNVRKLCTTQLLNSSKIESFAASRREEMGSFVAALREAAAAGEVVDLSERVGGVVEDMMYKMIVGFNKSDEFNLKGWIDEAMRLAGAFNISDYLPSLAPLDLQGLRRSLKKVSKELDKVLEKIVQEHEKDRDHHQQQDTTRDFVDTLLSMINTPLNPNDHEKVHHIVDKSTIKAIILDMIAGSFETSSTVVEWAMAELIRHPDVMSKLQQEIKDTIGVSNMVEESDLNKLNYLDMVTKETLRLHAVAPFLIPHESVEDVNIRGYYIPKKSRLLINYWSLSRNAESWSGNSEEFIPERFGANDMDIRGHDFRFIPFGFGRRGCPGIQLGITSTKLVLAQLVHCFDWELPERLKATELNMSEKFGLSMPRANRLLAKPTYRLLK